jgi:hypothetical protein
MADKKLLLEDKEIVNFRRLAGFKPKSTEQFLSTRKTLNEGLDAGGVPGEDEKMKEEGLPGEEEETPEMAPEAPAPEMDMAPAGDVAPAPEMGGEGSLSLSQEDAKTLISRIADAISGLTGLDIDVDTAGQPDGDGDADDMGAAPPEMPMAETKGDGMKSIKASTKNVVKEEEDEECEDGEAMDETKGDGMKSIKASTKNVVKEDEPLEEDGETMEETKGDGMKSIKASTKNVVKEDVQVLAKQIAKEALKEVLATLKKDKK